MDCICFIALECCDPCHFGVSELCNYLFSHKFNFPVREFFAPWISKNFAIFFQPFDHYYLFTHFFRFYSLNANIVYSAKKRERLNWRAMVWYFYEHTMCISKFNFYFHSLVRSRKTKCMNLYPCISVFRICTKQTVTSKWLFKRFYIFEVISGHRPFIHSIFIPEFQIEKGETQPDKK